MSRLVSQRKKLKPLNDLTADRWQYLGLDQAMPNLGPAPSTSDGYTLQQDIHGVTSFSSELGKLNFNNQKITPTVTGKDITIDGSNKSEIALTPNTKVTVNGKLTVTGDTTIDGKIKVLGTDPKGTAPFVGNTLYVSVDGDDTNDGRAQDSTRACRTIAGAIRSPYYQEGTTIRVAAGHYFEENPLVLLPNTSVIGNDLRTTFVEPLNKDLDLFHVNSGVYIAQMNMLNLRRGSVERYAPGGAGTYTTGAYATAFPPNLENPIDVYHSPYIQNCTNQSGPWLYDGSMFIPNQTVQIPDAVGTSTWTAGQYTLTVYVSTGTIVEGMAINDAANDGYRNAQLLLEANKSFLQNETVAYVNQVYNGFYYNQATCERDTGLIVDAIAQDLLFNTSSQSTFAGIQYWSQRGYVGSIPGEINTTTKAIQFAGQLAAQVITGTTGTRYQSTVTQITATLLGTSVEAQTVSDDFNVIVNILNRGTAGVTDAIVPNGIVASSATNIVNAYNALQINKEFIRNETLAYIDTLRSGFYYNQSNCGRDTGLIVDSIAFDLLYPTPQNSQSTFAGIQYWSQSTTTSAIIPGELTTTTSAIRYANSLTQLIVQNITTGTRYQNTVSQITNLPAATTSQATTINADFNVILNILNNGTVGVTDSIVPNSIDASTSTATVHAYNLIQANRDYIQREVVAYVNHISTGTGFTYDQATCYRDVGYMLDSVSFDLLHGGNKQAVQSGVYYYGYNTSTVLANEMPATLDAYQYLANLSQSIIQNVAVTPYQNTVTQVFSAFTATFTESADVYSYVNTITNIIKNGPSVAADKTPISLTSSTDTYSYQAAKLLESNRSFIQSEVIAYINSKYPPLFQFDEAKCYRDLGYMIDSVSVDLLYGGNRQAIQSGVAYYGYTTATVVPNEIPQVTAAYNYISSILPSIITGQTITPQQTVVTQITNLVGGQSSQGTQAQTILSTITNIINNGPDVAQPLTPLPLNPSGNPYVVNAVTLLEANRAFIQAEVIAYIGNNYFVYNQPLCFRDVGLIIDAVSGDARFGGNKRSIIAGLSYWSGTNSLIVGQATETVGAINYLASLASQVVANTPITSTYQTTVSQVIDPTKTNGAVVDTRLTTDFGIVTTIINGGPTSAPTTVDDIYALIVPSGLSPDSINTASQVTAVTEISTGCYSVTLNNPTIAASDNATVYFGKTSVYPFLDDQIPAYWSTSTNADRRLDPKGSGGGALVDGNAPSLKSPIQSFVFDAFTQLSQGGIGIHIINNGYAQLVSVFTLFCSTAVLVENGGIASITNSNANFGDQCLVAKGIGQLSFAGIIWNPPYPSNIPNSEYYPIGYWPNSQQMEVFIPDSINRPHIGQVMEVVPPDTYLDYNGNRVPYVNSEGYPGYLVASSNTGTVSTGSYTIDNIDITDVAIGHTLYIKDIYGNEGPEVGKYYLTPGTRVTDVNYRSITLDNPILNGGGDPNNNNYLNLYFCGNAYYNVLSSVVDTTLGSTVSNITVVLPTGEITTTSQAILHARDIALQIIANQQITTTYQTAVTQSIDPTFQNGTDASDIVAEKFNIIADIIQNGSGTGPDVIRPSQYVNVSEAKNSARRLLEKNRNFIQAETVGFVDSIWPSQFVYDDVKCSRDTGLIVDALAQDLLFNTSSQSTFAGIQYWNQQGYVGAIGSELTTTTNAVIHLQELVGEVLTNVTTGTRYFAGFAYDSVKCQRDTGLIVDSIVQDLLFSTSSQSTFAGLQYWAQSTSTSSIIPGEETTTTNAFKYVSSLVQQLVINSTGTRYQTSATQNVSLPAASTSATVAADFNVFLNILTSGTAGVTDLIIPNGITASTSTDAVNAYNIIRANRAYIQAEGVAYTNFISSGTGFTYSTTSCSRDIGFVIDSIAFDVLYGGNKQAVQSGVYYYNFTTTNTVIPGERDQTLGAYAHISNLLPWIVTGVTTGTYQQDVLQVTNLTPGTIADATKLQHSITTITNIITNGQTTSTVKSPIGMTITTTASMLHAATIVHANRDFIAAETVAYVNSQYNAQPFQITSTYTVSTATVNSVKADFQVIINILQNGIAGVTDAIVPNSLTSSTNADIIAAYDAIQDNREFLQREIVAYVNSTSNFSYNQDNCFRDTGLIVDAIAFDMMYPSTGNSQSTFAGIQYWNQSTSTNGIIPGELNTTTSAVIYLSSLAQQVVVNNTGTRYQNTTTQNVSLTPATTLDASAVGADFGVIINILQNGTAGITDTIIPNGQLTNTTSTNNAYAILQANREYMIEETLAYINHISSSTFVYNRDTCARDLGYMIDSVSFDLVHGGNRQAVQSGVYYYSYINTSTVITYELPQVNDAYNHLSQVVSTILLGNTVQKSPGNTATQVTYLLPASINEVASANQYVSTITNIINNGPVVASPPTPIGLTPNSNPNVTNAFNLLLANRTFIQNEVIAYIDSKYTGFTYDQNKCFRDVGFMLDSISFDTLYGGNRQAIQSGVYYYYYTTATVIPNEIPQTTAAYNYIKQIVQPIILGQTVTSPQQTLVPQVTNLSYTYNSDKCFRDTGILVDSFAIDLKFPVNGYTQSNFAGIQYWNQSGYVGAIPGEITTTTAAIQYLSNLAQQIVVNSTGTVQRFVTTASQVTNLTTATYTQLYAVKNDFQYILNILNSGTSGVTDLIVPNGLTALSTDATHAYNILQANKTYLQQQTLSYVSSIATGGFTFDTNKCYRDVGYMVDSVSFDILYGGNRQAIQSGVYYYSYDTSTAIPYQSAQTIAAYEHLRTIVPQIVQNQPVTPSPNNTATQVTTLTAATVFEANQVQSMVDLIVNIINNGPTIANTATSIGLTATSTATVLNATKILEANRNFIQEEVVNYVNYVYLVGQQYDVDYVTKHVDMITNIIDVGPSVAQDGTPIPLSMSNTTSTQYAATLLNANRAFITAEVTAYVDNTFNTKFKYDKTKCARDTGLIVDSIAMDILHGGTTQSAFSGLQYWNQDGYTGKIGDEITTTTNAFRYLKEVIQDVVQSNPITVSPTNTLTQSLFLPTGITATVAAVAADFDVILDILATGTNGITDLIEPNSMTASTDSSKIYAFNILQANRAYLQQEAVAYVDYAANPGYTYDQDKCSRDTGLIVDAIVQDMLFNTSSQMTFSGLQYWNQGDYTGAIASEITTTTNAIKYVSSLVQKVIQGITTGTRYQNTVSQITDVPVGSAADASGVSANFTIITNILSSGTAGVTDLIVPNGITSSTNVSTKNAYGIIQANKRYIQTEAVAYVNHITSSTGYVYSQDTCYRDVGYMLDSISIDLLYGGNRQAVQSGVYYYGYSDTASAIPGEQVKTTLAYDYIKTMLPYIVQGQAMPVTYQNTYTQTISASTGTISEVTLAQSKIDLATEIINFGPDIVADKTPISLTTSTNPNVVKAANLIHANRTFIQAEVIGYINQTTSTFTYNRDTCARDVGYMVDSVCVDILYGGNRQAVQSGSYYYGYNSTSTAIPGESTQTLAAYTYLRSIIPNVIEGIAVNSGYQIANPQVFNTGSAGTSVEAAIAQSNLDVITNIITYGPNAAPAKTPIGTTASTLTNVINAVSLLEANRDYFASEMTGYISSVYPSFSYSQSKCQRDTGLIIDAVAQDLLFGGTSQSTFAGLQYWNQASDTSAIIPGELTTTTAAISYVKSLAQQILLSDTSGPRYSTGTQVTTPYPGIATAAATLASNMDVVLNIIENGTAGVTDIIVPNDATTTDADTLNAYSILETNKDFIKNEVVARITNDNPGWNFDHTYCLRDVGFIIDCVGFDLTHTGNRQSVQAGVYYYGFGDVTAIPDEIPQTTAAYNYLREIVPDIITGQPVTTTYQIKVKQVTDMPVGTSAEVATIQTSIDTITNIIVNGPSVAPDGTPIVYTESTNTNVINTYNILEANREFIKAELTAYIDWTYTGQANYDKNKCYRDMGSIVDAVIFDTVNGGNYKSVNTGEGYYYRKGQYHIVTLEQNVTDPTLFIDGASVNFYQQSYISASGYLFEYVGAGTQYGALPQVGKADPVQSKETIQLNNGKVFFTSTDQNGDFRIGPTLVISQATGVLSGRTFQKSLYAEMTPFVLVIGGA